MKINNECNKSQIGFVMGHEAQIYDILLKNDPFLRKINLIKSVLHLSHNFGRETPYYYQISQTG